DRAPVFEAEEERQERGVEHHDVREGDEAEHRLRIGARNRHDRQVVERIGAEALLEEGESLDDGVADLRATLARQVPAQGIESESDLDVTGLALFELELADLEGVAPSLAVESAMHEAAAVLLPCLDLPAGGEQVVPARPVEGRVVAGAVELPGVGIPVLGIEQRVGAGFARDSDSLVLDGESHRTAGRRRLGEHDRDVARRALVREALAGGRPDPLDLEEARQMEDHGADFLEHRAELDPRVAVELLDLVVDRDVERVADRLERLGARGGFAVLAAERGREPGIPLAEVVELDAEQPAVLLLALPPAEDLALLLFG